MDRLVFAGYSLSDIQKMTLRQLVMFVEKSGERMEKAGSRFGGL